MNQALKISIASLIGFQVTRQVVVLVLKVSFGSSHPTLIVVVA
jgi:hypothetical protein